MFSSKWGHPALLETLYLGTNIQHKDISNLKLLQIKRLMHREMAHFVCYLFVPIWDGFNQQRVSVRYVSTVGSSVLFFRTAHVSSWNTTSYCYELYKLWHRYFIFCWLYFRGDIDWLHICTWLLGCAFPVQWAKGQLVLLCRVDFAAMLCRIFVLYYTMDRYMNIYMYIHICIEREKERGYSCIVLSVCSLAEYHTVSSE